MARCRAALHLFLFVKVRQKWSDDPERYRAMGIEFPEGFNIIIMYIIVTPTKWT